MQGKRKRSQESAEPKKPVVRKKIIQSTQKQLPIKDFANGTIITDDNRILKMLEVTAIPFINQKVNQQNMTRQYFENFLKIAPDSFQIKCISLPADLTKQIVNMNENINNERNEECRRLCEEYRKSLEKAQENNTERRYFIAFSNEITGRKNKVDNISNQIYKLNSYALRLCDSLKNCGNTAKPLNNNDMASVFYLLLNRNTYKEVPFEVHYEDVYDRYYNEYKQKEEKPVTSIYIPPTEYIAPKDLYFNDRSYVMCDNRYYTFLYISKDGYPSEVVCGWLNMFVDSFEGVDVDIFFHKKNKRKLKDSLRGTIGHSELDMSENYNDVSDSFVNASSKYQSARFLFEALQAGQEVYDVSVLLTVSGNSIEEITRNIEQINDDARSYDIHLMNLAYQNEQAFLSALPLNNLNASIENKAKRNVPQSTAATFYPFTSFQLIHDNGIYIADGAGNSPVIADFWNTRFVTNSLVFMCGMPGAGKTSALELIACRGRTMSIPVFIVAPEKMADYSRLCEAIDGQFIYIGPGSKHRINIMDILENSKNAEQENEITYSATGKKDRSYLAARVSTVFEFLHTNYPDMSQREQGFLKDAIMETYRRKGITEDNESLWADKEKTHYKEMPILSDLLEVIEENKRENETLYYSVKSLTEGDGSHFNGQTNINVNNTFFVIGTESNSSATKTLDSFLAEDFCQMKIREDRTTKTIYIIDEGWAMLNNEFTAKKMFEDARILRGYSCMFIFATQQMGDVLKSDKGEAIMKAAETRIIMKHKDEDIRYIEENIEISDAEKKMIRTFDTGQALMLANQIRLQIYFNPTDFEKLLTWNDPATLNRYGEYIKEKRRLDELAKQKIKAAENALNIADLLTDPRDAFLKAQSSNEYRREIADSALQGVSGRSYLKELSTSSVAGQSAEEYRKELGG